MRSNIVNILSQNPDYWIFLRQYPSWHRILSRHPERLKEFKEEYKVLRRKRFIDKMEDAGNMLSLMQALMEEM
ncbi:MAG: hypothetical protein IJV94_01175 [Bacilli bacterium]|nr:hypothetical protein [Bacilli bacterium]